MAVGAHNDYPFVLAHNRDEYFARATTPLQQNGDILCATDELSGGTWMGVNVATGEVAALTNIRSRPAARAVRSRGELVLRTLRGDAAAATTSSDYANFNLVHGRLSSDGTPTMTFAVSAPPDSTSHTQPVPHGDNHPFIGVKSNDHGGHWTTPDSDPGDVCTWPKAKWLCDEVARALAANSVQAAKGAADARGVLFDALEALMSARAMPGSPVAANVMRLAPYTSLSAADEENVQHAPCVTPFEMRSEAGPGDARAKCMYGTVSQTILIQCKSEGCLLYGYRAASPSGVDAESDHARVGGKRPRGDGVRTRRQRCASDAFGEWNWQRVALKPATAR